VTRSIRAEWARKSLHLATICIPLAVYFLPARYWHLPLLLIAALVLLIDLARLGHPRFGTFFGQMLGPYLRRHEKEELLGSTYLTLACVLSAWIFPQHIAVAVMGYLILGDGLAGLVGRSWGRVPLGFGKTLEGTLAGFIANLVVGALVFRSLDAALLGACVASFVEWLPVPLDDNFAIPVVAGVVLSLGMSA
jgi:dolichol kinase